MHRRTLVDRFWSDLANVEFQHGEERPIIAVRLNRESDVIEFTAISLSAASGTDNATVSMPFGRWLRLTRWAASGILSPGSNGDSGSEDIEISRQLEVARQTRTEIRKRIESEGPSPDLLALEQWTLHYTDLAEAYDRFRNKQERSQSPEEGADAIRGG